jgi:hypothetical protein
VVTTITQDPSLLPRPSRIQASGSNPSAAGGDFDSGLYQYDGAGNIVAIGSDNFAYDLRSRLTAASYEAATGAQSYSYDRYETGQAWGQRCVLAFPRQASRGRTSPKSPLQGMAMHEVSVDHVPHVKNAASALELF